MDCSELQAEECEVLMSIYEGDPAFNRLSPITYQYKFGEDGHFKSFLLEISWGDQYPNEAPLVNMNAFYNKHINQAVKDLVCEHVLKTSKEFIGSAMTYSLFESVREHFDELTAQQTPAEVKETETVNPEETSTSDVSSKKVKKEQLTKAQKRKQWDKVGGQGERPRGWDWVDVIRHLSQTGSKDDKLVASSN